MSAGPYSGYLGTKRKGDLLAIANDMGIDLTTGLLNTKFDLSDRIREALRSSKDLREDAQFIGLWHSMPDGRREGDYPIEEPQYDDEDDEDVPTPPRSTRRGLSSSASTSALSLRALPPGTPGRLTRSTSQHVSLYSKKSVSDLKEAAEKVKEETVKVVVEAQEKLSNAWSLTAGLVTIEAAYLAYSAVPFQDKTFGPYTWLTRSDTPAFDIPLPDLAVLAHPTFTHPFLKWSLISILLPLIVALFLAFPRDDRPSSQRIAPPNVVSFAVARLGLTVLTGYIFSRGIDKVQWSFEAVEGYPAISVLASSLALAFAAYEQSRERVDALGTVSE